MKVSLNIPYQIIARHVETHRGGLLFRGGKDWTGGTSHVEVRRAGAVHVHPVRSGFAVDMPVAVQLDIRRNDPAFMNLLKDWSGTRELRFSLLVSMELSPRWTGNWDWEPGISARFIWQEKPTVGTWLKMEVANWIEPAIQRQLDQAAGELRKELRNALALPALADSVWAYLQKPFAVADWKLRLIPGQEKLLRSDIRCGPQALHLDLDLPLEPEASPTCRNPALCTPLPNPEPGPPTQLAPQPDSLRWSCQLPLSWLEQTLSSQQAGSFRLEAVKLTPTDKGLHLAATLRWKGSAPVTCQLSVTAGGQTGQLPWCELSDLSIGWLPGFLVHSWEAGLTRSVNEAIGRALHPQILHWEQAIARWQIDRTWVLAANELSWEVDKVATDKNQLKIQGWLRGKVGLRAEEL